MSMTTTRPLPAGWREVEFSTLFREPLRNGHSARAAEDGKGIRTLTLSAVTYGDFSEVNTKITSASPDKADGLWLEPGDVLIERSNTAELVGTARVYRGRRGYAIFPDLMIRARLVPEVSDKFIEYFLSSEAARSYFRRSAQGIAGSMPKISQGTIEHLRVPLAPKAEQERIVAEVEKQFTRLDAGVEALKRLQAHLRRYRTAVLKAACEGRLVEPEAIIAARKRQSFESAEELVRRCRPNATSPDVKALHLPEVPRGWVWVTAEGICDRVVDCHNKTAPYSSSGILLLRTTNIRYGRLVHEDVRYVDEDTYSFWSRRCPPKPGDVLFTREAPVGEAGVIPAGLKVCMGQRMMLLRADPSFLLPRYLALALQAPHIKAYAERLCVGSGVKHLRVRDVEALPIPLPPFAEQQRIVAEADKRISLLEQSEATVASQERRATALRRALLKCAFEGRLVPPSPSGAFDPSSERAPIIRQQRVPA